MRHYKTLISCVFTILITLYSITSYAATFIYFNSDPGDYIGQGQEQTMTTEDGTITGSCSNNVICISFDGSTWWNLYFAAPVGDQVLPGSYEDATRYPFQSPVGNGLSISGDGRGCNKLAGRFDVLEAVYLPSGQIDRFAADFEQHCEGGTPALFGSVRYNATVGFSPKVTITANDSHTPITVKVGDVVDITISMEGGDDEGVNAETWLGNLGPSGNSWYKGKNWIPSTVPKKWSTAPISTFSQTFHQTFDKPGVYLLMFAADELLDEKLDTQFVDHVVVTVTK